MSAALYIAVYRENLIRTLPEAEKILMQVEFAEFYDAKRIRSISLLSFSRKKKNWSPFIKKSTWDRLFQLAQNLLFIPLLCNFLYFRIQQAHPGCVAILDLLVPNYTGLNRRNIVRLDRIRLCNFCPASGFPLTLYPNLPCPTLAPISCLKEWSFQWFYDYYTVAVFDGSRFSRK